MENVPVFAITLPFVTVAPTMLNWFVPAFVSVKPARSSVSPPPFVRMSKRPVPPMAASAVRVMKRVAWVWSAPPLMSAPSPPTPVPAMRMSSAPRFWPFTSRVPPELTVVLPAAVPSAAAFPARTVEFAPTMIAAVIEFAPLSRKIGASVVPLALRWKVSADEPLITFENVIRSPQRSCTVLGAVTPTVPLKVVAPSSMCSVPPFSVHAFAIVPNAVALP